MTRICITGGPRTGKTTLAASLGAGMPVTNCDDFIGMGWSESSAHVATLLERPGPWVIEGVQVARALRKWLAAHVPIVTDSRPCDRLIILRTPHVELTPGQRSQRGQDLREYRVDALGHRALASTRYSRRSCPRCERSVWKWR